MNSNLPPFSNREIKTPLKILIINKISPELWLFRDFQCQKKELWEFGKKDIKRFNVIEVTIKNICFHLIRIA